MLLLGLFYAMYVSKAYYIFCRQAIKGSPGEVLITTCRGLTEEGNSLGFLENNFELSLILQVWQL